jgi:hypothetical protein
VPIEHDCALVRGLCGANQRAEALGRGFNWSLLRALNGIQLGLHAGLEHGPEGELCEDMPLAPLPGDFVHTPFGVVLAQG